MRKIIVIPLILAMIAISSFYTASRAWAYNLENPPPLDIPIIKRVISVYINGEKAPLQFTAFINAQDRAMLSLEDCQYVLEANITAEPEDNRLIIRKGSQEFLLEKEDYLFLPLPEGENYSEDNLILDQYYLPLRFVAEQLGYSVGYNPQVGAVIIRSMDYQGPDPELVINPAPQLPADLPQWGTLAATPIMAELWPMEKIIAGYYTKLIASPDGRTQNIILSCGKINGTIVNSGEIFSFNKTVGPRTAAGGYQMAPVFVGKKVVPGIGGGICQTSSTLYNSALEANMPVLERHPHSLRVNYVPVGRDATVSWGVADLKFKNNYPYPIKILAQVYQDYVICAIAAVY